MSSLIAPPPAVPRVPGLLYSALAEHAPAAPQQHGAGTGAAAAEPVIFAVPAKQRQTHRISSRDAAALVRNGSLDRQWR